MGAGRGPGELRAVRAARRPRALPRGVVLRHAPYSPRSTSSPCCGSTATSTSRRWMRWSHWSRRCRPAGSCWSTTTAAGRRAVPRRRLPCRPRHHRADPRGGLDGHLVAQGLALLGQDVTNSWRELLDRRGPPRARRSTSASPGCDGAARPRRRSGSQRRRDRLGRAEGRHGRTDRVDRAEAGVRDEHDVAGGQRRGQVQPVAVVRDRRPGSQARPARPAGRPPRPGPTTRRARRARIPPAPVGHDPGRRRPSAAPWPSGTTGAQGTRWSRARRSRRPGAPRRCPPAGRPVRRTPRACGPGP